MEIRRLTKDDLDAYYLCRLRALENAPNAFLVTLEEQKARGTSHFEKILSHEGCEQAIFGAIWDTTVVGTIGIFREDRPKTRHKGVIWGMYVDSAQRQNGIGGQLLDVAIRFAKSEMQVLALYLSLESTNALARRLYESRGFECWGTEPKSMYFNGTFFDEDHMFIVL